MAWMLAQNRGARICWTPPGVYPWKWRHLLTVPFLFVGIVRLAWYLERRRRRRMFQHVIVASALCRTEEGHTQLFVPLTATRAQHGGRNGPSSHMERGQ